MDNQKDGIGDGQNVRYKMPVSESDKQIQMQSFTGIEERLATKVEYPHKQFKMTLVLLHNQ
jgi:hypothetical protein